MYRLTYLLMSVAAVAAASAWTPAAMADAIATSAGDEAAAAVVQPAAVSPFGGPVLDAGKLDGQRGGADLLLTSMDLDSKVHDNYAANMTTTGVNNISDGAFANMNGIPLVVQNTGNQVSIQNSTNIIIQVK